MTLTIDELCDCCGEHTEGWHPCPYSQAIRGSSDEKGCNCCKRCTHECEMNIPLC